MKTIKPYKIPTDEGMIDVSVMAVKSIYDNLEDHVVFQADFFIARGRELIPAGQAKVTLDSETYKTWDASMEGAYKLVAKQIGLEITGEYVEAEEVIQDLGQKNEEALLPKQIEK